MSIESPILPTFLPIEIDLNWSVIRVPIHFYSAPPGIETLIYHLMDLLISHLTWYNHAKWNLAFRKFSVLPYVKEILTVNKHLKQLPSSWKSQFQNRIWLHSFTGRRTHTGLGLRSQADHRPRSWSNILIFHREIPSAAYCCHYQMTSIWNFLLLHGSTCSSLQV